MSNKTAFKNSVFVVATKVLARWAELNAEDDRFRAKIQARLTGLPKREPTHEEWVIVQSALKKYDEIQKMKRILEHRLAAMKGTKPESPEAMHVYKKMLTVLDRNLKGLRELDRLLDKVDALRRKP
jgi:hypothetical protein